MLDASGERVAYDETGPCGHAEIGPSDAIGRTTTQRDWSTTPRDWSTQDRFPWHGLGCPGGAGGSRGSADVSIHGINREVPTSMISKRHGRARNKARSVPTPLRRTQSCRGVGQAPAPRYRVRTIDGFVAVSTTYGERSCDSTTPSRYSCGKQALGTLVRECLPRGDHS